uniref:Homoserine dehydrogenase / aspartate kinase n=1 Tax=Chlorobium chlorochromatii (strain CaD3) TaxID=340177 RepID=Q3AUA5_CHLCH
MKIYKFGGTSLGSAQLMKNAAALIAAALPSEPIIVVVSAIHPVTDLLLEAARQASRGDAAYCEKLQTVEALHATLASLLLEGENFSTTQQTIELELAELGKLMQGVYLLRELSEKSEALLVSFGERLSAKLLSAYLSAQQVAASFVDARALIVTDASYSDARVDMAASTERIQHFFKSIAQAVPVVTGFIAAAPDGSVTTLGRGGTDYTASILGAALGASEIVLWGDVDGFFSADPLRVRDAQVLPAISYQEAMELSHAGACVLHPLAVQPAMKAGIPLLIKNVTNPTAHGTCITAKGALPHRPTLSVTALTSLNNIVLLTMSGSGMAGMPGIASRLFSVLARHRINIIFISQASSEQCITLAINPQQAEKAGALLEAEFAREREARQIEPLGIRRNLSMIAVIGNNMSGHPGVSAQLFETLGKNGINVVAVAQGANEMNISLVVESHDEEKALNCIHESFFLSQSKVHLFIAGSGTIAKSLLGQIHGHRQNLHQTLNLDVVVSGIANTRMMAFSESGINLDAWETALEPRQTQQGIEGYFELIREKNLHNAIFVDCTASAAVAAYYPTFLQSNISVVTANKLGMAGSRELYSAIREAEKSSNARFLYETNVGAGLPIINTLNDLKNSGDQILSIQGVLSGTLSFIFNELRKGGRFSEIVRRAREAGYTEPDPRDDLSGADFARKFLILGRELGYQLNYADVVCESLVPPEYGGNMSVDEFLERLSSVDEWYEREAEQAAADGKTLAYAGEIVDGKASISVKRVPLSSPLATLNGSENMVVFTTSRYLTTPLVVKGPGAGGEVTAGGVFADILRVASYLV